MPRALALALAAGLLSAAPARADLVTYTATFTGVAVTSNGNTQQGADLSFSVVVDASNPLAGDGVGLGTIGYSALSSTVTSTSLGLTAAVTDVSRVGFDYNGFGLPNAFLLISGVDSSQRGGISVPGLDAWDKASNFTGSTGLGFIGYGAPFKFTAGSTEYVVDPNSVASNITFSASAAAAVPEPASTAMAALGVASAGALVRRARRRAAA